MNHIWQVATLTPQTTSKFSNVLTLEKHEKQFVHSQTHTSQEVHASKEKCIHVKTCVKAASGR